MKMRSREKRKLCYMGTDRFIYIKTEDAYIDIVKDVGTRFSNSN